MLAAVAVVLALLILPYFQKWLVQRSQLNAARQEIAQSRSEVSALEQQRARWQDPEYVKAQARQRLHFVMPGDTGYVVLDPPSQQQATTDPSAAAAGVTEQGRSWFGNLWQSVEVAGRR